MRFWFQCADRAQRAGAVATIPFAVQPGTGLHTADGGHHQAVLGAFGLFEWARASGASDAEARTVTVNAFVMVELFYLFNCRSLTKSMFQVGLLSNPWIVVGATSMIVLQLFYTYAPPMNRLFHSAPISLMDWVHIVAVSFLIYLVVGVEKTRRRRKTGSAI